MKESNKPAVAEAPEKKKIEDYEVDSACETLLRAEEVKKNDALMKLVRKKLAAKSEAIRSVADIRAAKDKMDMGEEDESDE